MITLQSQLHVDGVGGNEIVDFLLSCTDQAYQAWWPGTHLQLHKLARYPNVVPDKQRSRALHFACTVVAARFDMSRGQEILSAMQAQYQLLAPTIPPLKSRVNRMLLQIAVDTLAFYRALPSIISPE